MKSSSSLKTEFLKKWIKGLQICCSSEKEMNLMERKKKIKLSADIAMASAQKPETSWSSALLSDARRNEQDTILVNNLIGESRLILQRNKDQMVMNRHKRVRCKKILKTSHKTSGRKTKKIMMGLPRSKFPAVIAKRLVKKRTKVLKRLVPGGESMDEICLIKEALDYILSLKVQVDVMRSVVTATECLSDYKLLK